MTGVYSWPCTPAVSASTGPGFAPWMMLIGMVVPSSPGRAGTVSVPEAVDPGAAETGPIVNGGCACATAAASTLKTAVAVAALTAGRPRWLAPSRERCQPPCADSSVLIGPPEAEL